MENDLASGKNTLAAQFGEAKAKQYQYALFMGAVLCTVIYDMQFGQAKVWGLLGLFPAFMVITKVKKADTLKALDPLLKIQAIGALVYALVWGASQLV
jgi:1,4-dihydroxy-2-naphthoate octaprenyltransferase